MISYNVFEVIRNDYKPADPLFTLSRDVGEDLYLNDQPELETININEVNNDNT